MEKMHLLLLLLTSLVIMVVQAELYLGTEDKNPSRHFIGTAETKNACSANYFVIYRFLDDIRCFLFSTTTQ
jgi:hypothetical protein